MRKQIYAIAQLDIRFPDPVTGKPYLQMTFGDTTINITCNIGEMIGGAARGAMLRHEDGKMPFERDDN